MEIPVEVCVFVISLLAPGVLYTINKVPAIQDALPLLGLGALVLGSVVLMGYLAVRRKKSVDPLYYVFAAFCFTCLIGLTNALEQDGFISGFMTFYIKKGEPHLSTAYAVMMCYWEGVVHYLLLLTMIRRMFRRKSYRNLGLLWVGSSIAHQIIFIPGVVIGKYGSNIHPAFWRNTPFLLLPIWAAFLLFNRPRDLSVIPADKVEEVQRKGLLFRPTDLLLSLVLLLCMGLCVFRGMVVLECPLEACFNYIYQYEPYLKDPVSFPRLTVLVQLFYFLPLLAVSLYGLQAPGCTWMLDWTLLFAGAVAQTQWCHIGGALHSRTPFTYRTPTEKRWLVLILNLVLLAGPVLLALRCHARPAFFLKEVPKGQSSKNKKKN